MISTKNSKILIVEDYPLNVTIVKKILEEKKYIILVAETSKQAFEILSDNTDIDLILLDVILPDENGFDICKKLKINNETKHIPVIFLTALQDIEYIQEGFLAGGVDYIPKAYLETELIYRVENHLAINKSNKLLTQNNEKLKGIIDSRNQFYSIIAHDLKNPLTTLLITTKWLNADFDSINTSEVKQYLKEMDCSAQKMSELLENLLQWAHFQSDSIVYNPEFINLSQEIEKVLALFKLDALRKNIIIKNNIIGMQKVYTDKNILHVLLRNFIANAIKFTNKLGKVTISNHETSSEYIVSIKDTGIGIEENRLIEIKQGFTNYATAGTNLEKGSGIGLSVCFKLIKLMQKKLEIESIPNKGTTISFGLNKNK